MNKRISSMKNGLRLTLLSFGKLFTSLLIIISFIETTMAYDRNDRKNGVSSINSPRANSSYFTFPRELKNGDNVSVIFNLKDKSWKVFKFAGEVSIYPRPGQLDETVIYYTHISKNVHNQKVWSIVKCAIDGAYCQEIFSQDKVIGNFTEVPGKGFLFGTNIISQDDKGHDLRGSDLFFRDNQGKIKRLTEFGFYQLGSLNILNDKLIFFAYAPKQYLLRQKFPKTTLIHNKIEGVFSCAIDTELNLKIDESVFIPLLTSKHYLSKPSVIDGIPYAAVLQRWASKGGRFRYDLAIYDLRTGEPYDLIEAEDFSISRPTILKDGRVVYLEYVDQTYKIYSYSIANKQAELLATLSTDEIANAKIQTLHLAKEL